MSGNNKQTLPSLKSALSGEFLGTFVLVFFSIGSAHAAAIGGAQMGVWQVAVVAGIGVTLGIYTAATLSGAHINPAVTLMFAVWNGFPVKRILPYWIVQITAGVCAGFVVHYIFADAILAHEAKLEILRGEPGSQLSAMAYGLYFPNPATYGTGEEAWQIVGMPTAFIAEIVGTGVMAFVIAAVIHPYNDARPNFPIAAVVIGVCVAAIISVLGPITMGCMNPARDFGPRLAAFFLGWGNIAIPGPRGGFFIVYILGPMVGAVVGAGLYKLLATRLPKPANTG